MKPRSLRRDLALGLGAGLTLLWIVAMLGAVLIVREELDEIYDSLMEETADRLLPLTLQQSVALPPQAEALLTWVMRDKNGSIVLQSGEAKAATFATIAPDGFSTIGDDRHFVRSDGTHSLDVASPLQERREATWGVLSALIWPTLILLPLSLLGVAWFTSWRLRPVSALSAEVAGRHPDDLRPLATQGLQSELLPVQDEVNRLMSNLRDALDAERAFSANAAHEMRTPIAATLAHVQRLVAEAPQMERARKIETELKRVTRLVEKLLQLARAENVGTGTTDIVQILALVASDFNVPAAIPETPVLSRIDPDSFAILTRNLLENAVIHGYEAQVSLSADGLLRVTNRGPVIPADILPTLTQRFERAEARTAGSGLGLAIVAAIVRNGGFGFGLLSPANGQDDGFEAWVHLSDDHPAAH